MIEKLTFTRLHNILENAALSHESVASWNIAEIEDLSPDGGAKPTHVFMELPLRLEWKFGEHGMPTQMIFVTLSILDRMNTSLNNSLEVFNKTTGIASWIVSYLHTNHSDDLSVVNAVVTTLPSQYHDDSWTGMRMDLELTSRFPVDACDVIT